MTSLIAASSMLQITDSMVIQELLFAICLGMMLMLWLFPSYPHYTTLLHCSSDTVSLCRGFIWVTDSTGSWRSCYWHTVVVSVLLNSVTTTWHATEKCMALSVQELFLTALLLCSDPILGTNTFLVRQSILLKLLKLASGIISWYES